MFEFRVQTMKCGGCASRVTKAIQMVDSGAVVDVILESKTVRITSTARIDDLAVALAAAGYPATIPA
jgi:copper chaperone